MKFRSAMAKTILGAVAAGILFLIFLPTVLSISFIQSGLFYGVKVFTGYEIECESASFGWLSGVDVNGLKVKDRSSHVYISLTSFHLPTPIYSILRSPDDLGVSYVNGFRVVITSDKNDAIPTSFLEEIQFFDDTALSQAKKIPHLTIQKEQARAREDSRKRKLNDKSTLEIPQMKADMEIGNSRIYVRQPSGHYAAIEDINAQLSIDKNPSVMKLRFTGNIISSEQIKGSRSVAPLNLEISFTGKELFDDLSGRIIAEVKEIPSFFIEGLSSIFCESLTPLIRPLFGHEISLSFNSEINPSNINISSQIQSDNAKSSLSLIVTENQIEVAKGKLLEMSVSNELFQALVEQHLKDVVHQQLALQKPVRCAFTIDESAIYSFKEDAFLNPLRLRLSHSPSFSIERRIEGKELKSIALDCALSVLGDMKHEKIDFSLIGGYQKGTETSSIISSIETFKPNGEGGNDLFAFQGRDFKGAITCQGALLRILSNELSLPLSTLLGSQSTHSIEFEGTINKKGFISYTGDIVSTLEKGKKSVHFTGNEKQVLFEKGQGSLFIPYNNIQEALGLQRSDYIFSFDSGVQINSELSKLFVPLSWDETALHDIFCDLNTNFDLGNIGSRLTQFQIDSGSKVYYSITKEQGTNYFSVAAQSEIPFVNTPEYISKQVPKGSPLLMNISLDAIFDKTIQTSIHSFTIGLAQALNIEASEISCIVDPQKQNVEVILNRPCFLQVAADAPDFIQVFPKGTPLTIQSAISSTTPFIASKKGGSQSGTFDIKNTLSLHNGKYDVEFPFFIDIAKRMVRGSCNILASSESKNDPSGTEVNQTKSLGSAHFLAEFPYDLSIQSLRDEATCKIDASLMPFSTKDLNAVFAPQVVNTLSTIVGPEVNNFSLKTIYRGISSKENEVNLSLKADNLKLTAQANVSNGLIISDRSPFLSISCTPSQDLFKLFGMSQDLKVIDTDLASKKISLEVNHVSLPLRALRFSQDSLSSALSIVKETNFDFTLTSDSLEFSSTRESSSGSIKEKKFGLHPLFAQGTLNGNGGTLETAVKMKQVKADNVAIANAPDIKANISAKFPVDREFASFSELAQSCDVDASVQIEDLEPAFISKLLNEDKDTYEDLLGTRASSSIKLKLTENADGKASIQFTSDNCRFNCEGNIEKGVFLPSQPTVASVKLSRKIGKYFLQGFSSFFAKAIQTEKPITISIPQDGVSIPIIPFSLPNLAIPKAKVEVDRVLVKNGGALKLILKLLRVKKSDKQNEVELWCTPIYLSVKNGVITCDRLDALAAGKVELAVWGTADLINDQFAMNLLIPNTTLRKLGFQAFSMSGLIVPITGPVSDPGVDTARLTAKLAGIGLRSTTVDPSTQILSGLLEVAAGIGEDTGPVPPPTTSPLPWEK